MLPLPPTALQRPAFPSEEEASRGTNLGTETVLMLQEHLRELSERLQLPQLPRTAPAPMTSAGLTVPCGGQPPTASSCATDAGGPVTAGPSAHLQAGGAEAAMEAAVERARAVKKGLQRIQEALAYRERHPYEAPTQPPLLAALRAATAPSFVVHSPTGSCPGDTSAPPRASSRGESKDRIGPALSPFERARLGKLLGQLVLDMAMLSTHVQEGIATSAAPTDLGTGVDGAGVGSGEAAGTRPAHSSTSSAVSDPRVAVEPPPHRRGTLKPSHGGEGQAAVAAASGPCPSDGGGGRAGGGNEQPVPAAGTAPPGGLPARARTAPPSTPPSLSTDAARPDWTRGSSRRGGGTSTSTLSSPYPSRRGGGGGEPRPLYSPSYDSSAALPTSARESAHAGQPVRRTDDLSLADPHGSPSLPDLPPLGAVAAASVRSTPSRASAPDDAPVGLGVAAALPPYLCAYLAPEDVPRGGNVDERGASSAATATALPSRAVVGGGRPVGADDAVQRLGLPHSFLHRAGQCGEGVGVVAAAGVDGGGGGVAVSCAVPGTVRPLSSGSGSPSDDAQVSPGGLGLASHGASLVRHPHSLEVASAHAQAPMLVSSYYHPRSYSIHYANMSSLSSNPKASDCPGDGSRPVAAGSEELRGRGRTPAMGRGGGRQVSVPGAYSALSAGDLDSFNSDTSELNFKRVVSMESQYRSDDVMFSVGSAHVATRDDACIPRVDSDDSPPNTSASGTTSTVLSSAHMGPIALCSGEGCPAPHGRRVSFGDVPHAAGSLRATLQRSGEGMPRLPSPAGTPPTQTYFVVNGPRVREFAEVLEEVRQMLPVFTDEDFQEADLCFAIPGLGVGDALWGRAFLLPPTSTVTESGCARSPSAVLPGSSASGSGGAASAAAAAAAAVACALGRQRSQSLLPLEGALGVEDLLFPLCPGGEAIPITQANFESFYALVTSTLREVERALGRPLSSL